LHHLVLKFFFRNVDQCITEHTHDFWEMRRIHKCLWINLDHFHQIKGEWSNHLWVNTFLKTFAFSASFHNSLQQYHYYLVHTIKNLAFNLLIRFPDNRADLCVDLQSLKAGRVRQKAVQ